MRFLNFLTHEFFTLTILLFVVLAVRGADPEKREKELLQQLKSSHLSENEKIIVWYNLASVYIGYKPDKARLYANKLSQSSIELARQYGCMTMAGITLNEGKYDSTELYLKEALSRFHSSFSDDAKMGSEIYNRFGHLYTVRSSSDNAIKHYLKALSYSEIIDDYAQMCAICTNISYLYGQVGAEIKVKLEYAYKALGYAEKSKDIWAMEQAYSMLGNTLQEADSTEKALEYQLKGLELSRKMKSEQKECFAALNIGCNYLQINELEKAEKYFLMALDLSKRNSLKRPEAYILSCLADVYREKKQYDKSGFYVEEAMQKKGALSDSEQLDVYLAAINLSVVKGDLGDFEKYFEAYSNQLEKVHNTVIHEKMVELETQYETEKKEKRISELKNNQFYTILIGGIGFVALLALALTLFFRNRLVNSKKSLAEQKVAQMEQEKRLITIQAVLDGETNERSRLARDLHDGLGGMLSVVKLNLNGIKSGAFVGDEDVVRFAKALTLLDDSIKELRRVAHHMMPESLLKYGLKASLSDFCNDIPSTEFHYFGNNDRLDSQLEIIIYRAAHELVNNALRHANATKINLQLVQEIDRISLTVQDDGKGFDPDAVKDGMGLENINKRVASLDGKMSIYSSPDSGTEINIEFQLN